MSRLLRQRVVALLEQCECEQEVTEHHIKLSDKPDEAYDLSYAYGGNDYTGWLEKGDECKVVLFVDAGDGTNHYVEETCDDDEQSMKDCIKQAIKKLSSYLN